MNRLLLRVALLLVISLPAYAVQPADSTTDAAHESMQHTVPHANHDMTGGQNMQHDAQHGGHDMAGTVKEHAEHDSANMNHEGHAAPDTGPESMEHGNHTMVPDGKTPDLVGHVHKEPQPDSPMAGVDEKLGEIIPEGIIFKDESGNDVDVRSLMTLPTIIAPVYYNCPSVCNVLQSSIARIIPQMSMTPGQEYRVLSVSFDETDTPELAARRKRNYLSAIQTDFPEDSWRFLSGSKESVDKFMDAIGFRFTRTGKDFVHPVVVVVASPDGKIVRYLYGNDFLPFDTAMALSEAAQGKVGLSLKRIVSYCFAYDPQGKRYVLDVFRIAGVVVLFGVAVLFFVLTRGGRKSKKRQ